MKYGFWNDLSMQLFDPGASSWIQALPVGSYEHPVYGRLDFTPDKIQRFAASVNSKVRGIDPDIDYDHKDKSGKAAGWVRAADVRDDGLYIQVDWTQAAADAIKAGEYRYFSPEFDDEWTDAQGTKHTDVLFGGALTNRPFLKNLLPVNLSEITAQQPQGGKLDPKQLRVTLKLSESASDADVLAAIKKLADAEPSSGSSMTHTHPPTMADGAHSHGATPACGPDGTMMTEEALAKMLAENPLLRQLMEGQETLRKQLAESQRQHALSETRHRLSSLQASQNGRKYVLPPSVVDAIAEGSVLGDPVKMSEAFVQGLEQLTKVGFVELGERGRMGSRTEKDATTTLAEQIIQTQVAHFKATGKQLAYADAARRVVHRSPDLYLEYRQDAYAGKEDN